MLVSQRGKVTMLSEPISTACGPSCLSIYSRDYSLAPPSYLSGSTNTSLTGWRVFCCFSDKRSSQLTDSRFSPREEIVCAGEEPRFHCNFNAETRCILVPHQFQHEEYPSLESNVHNLYNCTCIIHNPFLPPDYH